MTAARFATKADILRDIEKCSHDKSWVLPLLAATYNDQLSLVCAGRGGAAVPLKALDRARMPAIVLVGDDVADGFDVGPSGWPGAKRIMRWARAAIIHASGGQREHYAQFVELTLLHRKLLVIETGTSRACDWLKLCQDVGLPAVVLKPVDGSIQPAPFYRGARQ